MAVNVMGYYCGNLVANRLGLFAKKLWQEEKGDKLINAEKIILKCDL